MPGNGCQGKGRALFSRAIFINPYNLLAAIVFGTIGLGAFSFGKKLDRTKPMMIGVALMVYPYLFSNTWWLWGIGVALLVTLWFHHDT